MFYFGEQDGRRASTSAKLIYGVSNQVIEQETFLWKQKENKGERFQQITDSVSASREQLVEQISRWWFGGALGGGMRVVASV